MGKEFNPLTAWHEFASLEYAVTCLLTYAGDRESRVKMSRAVGKPSKPHRTLWGEENGEDIAVYYIFLRDTLYVTGDNEETSKMIHDEIDKQFGFVYVPHRKQKVSVKTGSP